MRKPTIIDENEDITVEAYFKSTFHVKTTSSLESDLDIHFQKVLESIETYQNNGSGYMGELDMDGIDCPTTLDQIPKFEQQNPGRIINVMD